MSSTDTKVGGTPAAFPMLVWNCSVKLYVKLSSSNNEMSRAENVRVDLTESATSCPRTVGLNVVGESVVSGAVGLCVGVDGRDVGVDTSVSVSESAPVSVSVSVPGVHKKAGDE